MVWHTLETLGPRVQASRMVREYVDHGYLPASRMVAAATGDGYRGALSLADYRTKLEVSWPRLRIFDSELVVAATEPLVVGTEVTIRARIDLAGLDPSEVDIQAVVGRVGDDDELHDTVTVPMTGDGIGAFAARVKLPRPGAIGYTVRVLPRHGLLAAPAELARVVLA
jgi:starch phosphorylase